MEIQFILSLLELDAFPVIKDLVVDRTSFDRIQQAGGFISVNTSGNTKTQMLYLFQNTMQIKLWMLQLVLVVVLVWLACKNSSAMLFVGAKVSQYALLPQGQVEAAERAIHMVETNG